MSWFKVDDGLWSDARMMSLSDGALALWLRAGTYSAQKLTDGFIPADAIRMFQTRKRYVDELVAKGVWVWQPSGGWLAANWQENIQSRDTVLARRSETKQRVNKHRNAVTNSVSNAAPGPGPGPISSVNQVADTKTSVPALKPPVASTAAAAPPSPAGRGSRLIHEATLVEWHPVAKKHRDALAALGAKPDAEWRIAGEVLRQESLKPGVASNVLNPDHILAHWHLYSTGQAPGSRQLLKLAASDAPAPRYREL